MASESVGMEDPGKIFENLLIKSMKLGISTKQIASLKSVEQLRAPAKKKYVVVLLSLLVCLLSIVGAICAVQWPVSRDRILRLYFTTYGMEPAEEECVFEMNEIALDLFRPPVKCQFCAGITEIEKVSNLTPVMFESKYAYSARPVVIVDGTTNWTATQTFSFKFFKNVYGENSPILESADKDCQFFPYKTEFETLGDVFSMGADRASLKDGAKPWYIGWSNCDSSAANVLRKHYKRPYFLPEVSESSKTDWIFMGSPGYGAHLHIDNVDKPSWQAQVTGTKKWTLEPPPECYYKCLTQKMEVVLNPGDIIVVDTNKWFHSTLNVGNDISITIGSEYD